LRPAAAFSSLLSFFQTRIVALILAGFALAAALAFHNKFSDGFTLLPSTRLMVD
jgi:uncharacterized membrane protein YphA (DoxX/SURF4 family)